MNQFIAFTKKELYESAATFRLYILLAVFLLLGMLSPLMTKLLPEILGNLDDPTISIVLHGEPSATDAWASLWGNVAEVGAVVLVITFGGIISGELSKGTLINLLTKGLKRRTVILSKFLSASLIWTACYLLCVAACYAYTAYLFDAAALHNVFLAFLSPWLFGEMLIALLIFGGVLFGNFYGSLLSCAGAAIVLMLVNLFPNAQKYNPISLMGDSLNLLTAQKEAANFIPALIICGASVALLLFASVAVFNRKRV